MLKLVSSDALIIVDLQNDFCGGGALAVPLADEIVEPINHVMPLFPFVVTTQDWHPANHISFKAQGGPWPPHCIQNTRGAELHPKLQRKGIHLQIHKGQFPDRDAYSGFVETSLAGELKKRNVKRIFVAGLATDYCVKQTALDGIRNHWKVVVLTDLVRGVGLHAGDVERALNEIREAGGLLALSSDLRKQ